MECVWCWCPPSAIRIGVLFFFVPRMIAARYDRTVSVCVSWHTAIKRYITSISSPRDRARLSHPIIFRKWCAHKSVAVTATPYGTHTKNALLGPNNMWIWISLVVDRGRDVVVYCANARSYRSNMVIGRSSLAVDDYSRVRIAPCWGVILYKCGIESCI